jgi:WD40 repeat protein
MLFGRLLADTTKHSLLVVVKVRSNIAMSYPGTRCACSSSLFFAQLDNHVYVWNRKHGSLLQVLEGHNAMVNSVCWNPKNPNLFASASDDKTVHM